MQHEKGNQEVEVEYDEDDHLANGWEELESRQSKREKVLLLQLLLYLMMMKMITVLLECLWGC